MKKGKQLMREGGEGVGLRDVYLNYTTINETKLF